MFSSSSCFCDITVLDLAIIAFSSSICLEGVTFSSSSCFHGITILDLQWSNMENQLFRFLVDPRTFNSWVYMSSTCHSDIKVCGLQQLLQVLRPALTFFASLTYIRGVTVSALQCVLQGLLPTCVSIWPLTVLNGIN